MKKNESKQVKQPVQKELTAEQKEQQKMEQMKKLMAEQKLKKKDQEQIKKETVTPTVLINQDLSLNKQQVLGKQV